MCVWTGLDRLIRDDFQAIRGRRIGLVCNQASVSGDYRHVLESVLPIHLKGEIVLGAVFGPQHGLFGHTQDNMIEWEADGRTRLPVPLYSLYGLHREPTSEMLAGLDLLVIDLQDVGSRYYTFIWTLALCLKACEREGIEVMVLDRPNPIGGERIEGTLLDPSYASFVGLYPLPIRHGLTIGELAMHFRSEYFPGADLNVMTMDGWRRANYMDETGAPWAVPSPNMPTVDTAVVYPGACFIEATNLSEGRGTTRPFEIIGAPYLDGWRFAEAVNGAGLAGVRFRPIQFEPTFNKHARTLCEGVFLHVTDRHTFDPVLTFVALLQETIRQAGSDFRWNPPPYEYEYEKLPIDILAGNAWLRQAIEDLTPLPDIRARFRDECARFEPARNACLVYRS